MKSLISCTLFLLLSVSLIAQQKFDFAQMQKVKLDSLHSLLRHATNDTLRMDAYRQLGFYYAEINRDSSLRYGERQLVLAKKLNQKFWEAKAISHIGYVNYRMENYPAALKDMLQAEAMANDPEIEKNIWGLRKDENPKQTRLKFLAAVLNDIANLYGATGNSDKQLILLKKILIHADSSHDDSGLGIITMNLARVYQKKNRIDSALLLGQKSIKYADRSGYKKYKGGVLLMLGSIYYEKKQYDVAKNYYQQSLQTNLEQRNIQSVSDTYIYLADLFRATGKTDSSIYYAKKGLENFQILHSPTGMLTAYTSLAATYKIQNDINNAFAFLQLAKTLSDSLNKKEKEKLKQILNIGFDEQLRLEELEKEKIQSQNRLRTYAMLSGLGVILLIVLILYRSNRQKQQANVILNGQKEQIQQTLEVLKSTQAQLIQSEKMASLGELTAGIAHEIQNPLNFVNNFSEVSTELVDELKEGPLQNLPDSDKEYAEEILGDLSQNLQKITHHGQRASSIVKGMLEHSRSGTGERQPTDLNALADEYLRLAYQGLRAKDKTFNCTLTTDFDPMLGSINVVSQDIGRVLLNLFNNAFYAVGQRAQGPEVDYKPTVWVSTKKAGRQITIVVTDNGTGIPESVKSKIFQPFFTTKPTGQGTGLGLSLSYDIVTKGHQGIMAVDTQEGQGTTFTITLPMS